jgi:hypothetical protein
LRVATAMLVTVFRALRPIRRRSSKDMTKQSEVRILPGNVLAVGEARLTFQRTLRIPDDGRSHPLPPGLGAFPLRRVDDYASRVPDGWAEHGGVFLPMYQREAMWLSFAGSRPNALQIGIGKVCAVSGGVFGADLRTQPQNYVVTGTQPWLDGIASGKGTIRQFVAMPLGLGYTVEAQVTGEERFGGLQLRAFCAKPGRIPEPRMRSAGKAMPCAPMAAGPAPVTRGASMGLAAGGRMKQKVYPDPHGVDAWDTSESTRVFVHLVNSELWREITGESAPPTPVSAASYTQAGLPWFELYDEHAATIDPTSTLAAVKSVDEIEARPGFAARLARALGVRDGNW